MKNMLNEVFGSLAAYLPSLLAALAILIVGWIIAMVVARVLRGVLRRLEMNRRITSWTKSEAQDETPDIENGIAKGVFFLVMLFVLIAFFQTLRMTLVTEPLTLMLNELFKFAPQLLGAVLLLVAAWVVAKLCQIGVRKMLAALHIDERLGQRIGDKPAEGGGTPQPVALTKSLSDAVFGVVFLLFLPAILDALSLQGLLKPVQGMINKILSFLPNLVTAGIIFVVGWFVARLVQQIVTNLLVAVGTDSFSEKIGLAKALGNQKLSSVCGFILYAFLLIPVAIAGLTSLQLNSITQPASNMLNMILSSMPNIFAAGMVVIIGFILGKLVSGLVANLLAGVGFDSITARLGFAQEKTEETILPSRAIGYLTMVIIVFFSLLEACNFLGFTDMTQLLKQFMLLAGHVLFGVVIFAVGFLAANTVHKIVQSSGMEKASFVAAIARGAILIFVGAMALRQMGLANDIINLAFGLLIGAIALAAAIAFGLGSREIAARELEGWISAIKEKTK